jgi:transglutaminase-like putative cysteine protease
MTSKIGAIWWALVLLSAMLLVASYYQRHRVKAALAPLRETSTSDQEFAVRATVHLNERQRRFATTPQFKLDNPDSLSYRFPLFLLDGGGGCSQRSTLLVAILDAYGIPARKLLIGLTDQYAGHVVVEALLDGKWRVLDPLFGYVYPLDSGELATAEDLRKNPDLVARVAHADTNPFPIRYRLDAFNYREVTRFNWFRLKATLALRDYFGQAADDWAPPAMWNRPLRLTALLLLTLLVPLSWLYYRRRLRRG